MIEIRYPSAADAAPSIASGHDAFENANDAFVVKPQRSIWLIPVAAIVVTLVAATITLGAIKWNLTRTKSLIENDIAAARRESGAAGVVAYLEEYTERQSKLPPSVHGMIEKELATARQEVDDADYAEATKLDVSGADLDAVEAALQGYLAKHADGRHATAARTRLGQIPGERETRAYQAAAAAASASKGNLDAEEVAWRTYLHDYPRGRNAAAAQGELNKIPDRRDEVLLADGERQAEDLFIRGQVEDALDQLAKTRDALKSKARRERVDAIATRLESRLEALDRDACLGLATGGDALHTAAARCRLYLLCYPRSAERQRIVARLEEVEKAIRRDAQAAAQKRLAAVRDSPTKTVDVVEELLRSPELDREMLLESGGRAHLKLLADQLRDSLGKFQLIKLIDGFTCIGSVQPANGIWSQVCPRPGSNGRKRLVRTADITSQVEPPLLGEFHKLLTRELAIPLGQLKLESLADRLRGLTDQDRDLYAQERELIDNVITRMIAGGPAATTEQVVPYIDHFKVLEEQAAAKAIDDARRRLPEQRTFNLYRQNPRLVPVEWELGTLQVFAPQREYAAGGVVLHLKRSHKLISRLNGQNQTSLAEIERINEGYNENSTIEFLYDVLEITIEQVDPGIEFEHNAAGVVVRRCVPMSSAENLKLEPGDRLRRVGNTVVEPQTDLNSVRDLINAAPPKNLSLTFSRLGRRFTVQCDKVKYNAVRYRARSTTTVNAAGLELIQDQFQVDWSDVPGPP